MNEFFAPDEKLFRAVRPDNVFWRDDGTLTSAAFKDSKGLSVDREGDRSFIEAVTVMKQHFDGKIVWVTVEDCNAVNALVRYLPTEDNAYHSEIHKDEQKIPLSSGQAKRLAVMAHLVIESVSPGSQ